jgi:hypothetical protein
MSTKSRQTIFGGAIIGAKIHADGARKRADEAIREADRAEAEAWSIQMEAYGGRRSHRRHSHSASMAVTAGSKLNANVRPAPASRLMRYGGPRHGDLEAGSIPEMPIMKEGPLRAAGAHDQANRSARDLAIQVRSSGRVEV